MEDLEKTKVGIYARVSTGMQGESLDEQRRILVDFCEKKNYDIYKVYSETSSGAKSDRKKFVELMRDVEAKKFDAVVVLKLDRFSRSMVDLLTNVERLKERGVDFISIKDNIETGTAQGKLMFHLMGAFAEFERSLIYERTKVGIERAKREGKVCHRPRKNINLDRVVDRYKQGTPLTEIAVAEHVSYSTLRNRLRESGIKLNKSHLESKKQKIGEYPKGMDNPNWKPKVTFFCRWCGKRFRVNRSRSLKTDVKYCCKKCRSEALKGEKHPNWLGGVSFEPYCIKFNASYKAKIRNLFGNECFLCGLSEAKTTRALSTHHVNYNKDCGCDGEDCICVPLCIRCHAKTNRERDYWQALIMEMLAPIEAWFI